MKRILHIIGAMNRAGAESMLMNLYRVLDKNIYQFDFLYFTNEKCDFDDEILALGGKIYRITNNGFVSRFKSTYIFLKENRNFHAIHSHTLLNNGTNLFAAYIAGYKIRISHSHSTANLPYINFQNYIYYHFSKFLINTFSNRLIACGIQAGAYLYYKKNKFLLLPNAVNFEDFSIAQTNIRRDLKIEEETLLICQIGRFLEVKNQEFTVELARYMQNNHFDFHFIFVGKGPLEKEIARKVKSYHLESKVTFLGLRSDIPKILKESDCLILTSFHEGFPVVLVESQVAGTPALISSNISKEVDLGVDLVLFESLSSDFKIWSDKLKTIRKYKKKDDYYKETLKNKGFDINSSLEILLNFYNNV